MMKKEKVAGDHKQGNAPARMILRVNIVIYNIALHKNERKYRKELRI